MTVNEFVEMGFHTCPINLDNTACRAKRVSVILNKVTELSLNWEILLNMNYSEKCHYIVFGGDTGMPFYPLVCSLEDLLTPIVTQ